VLTGAEVLRASAARLHEMIVKQIKSSKSFGLSIQSFSRQAGRIICIKLKGEQGVFIGELEGNGFFFRTSLIANKFAFPTSFCEKVSIYKELKNSTFQTSASCWIKKAL